MLKLKLLPRKLRWIPYFILVLGICSAGLKMVERVDSKILSHLVFSILNIGLLLMFLTKRKLEDEMFIQIRLNNALGGLIFGVTYSFVNMVFVWLDWLDSYPTAEQNLFVVLLTTNLMFWFECYVNENKGNEE
ncbi:hypothetical protein [Myroides guanonis]|uniref:Uncharacterized protein n=1 Tax=Myroides guanonis TaxID=1150112 RepID=A0A1I3M9B0_9FLAO|nr:hypothetical protein [Myroides guanonis]SFI93502.1 hypothetical protein SAMN04487893_10279 [Myroides guanonis]